MRDSSGQWVPLFIGEGDLAQSSDFERLELLKATHVHMHLATSDELRRAEANDLKSRYPNNP